MAKDHSKERETPEAGAIPASGSVPQVGIPVIVLGSAEALPLLTKVWEQKAVGTVIIPIEIGEGPFSEVIDQVIVNDDIPDSFIIVPANCFPTHRVNLADLTAYRVRRMKPKPDSDKWVVTPCTGLPFLVEATAVLQALEKLGDTYTEEEFLEVYNGIAHPGELPEEIGMTRQHRELRRTASQVHGNRRRGTRPKAFHLCPR